MTYDRKPTHRHPITIAGELAREGHTEAGLCINNLFDLVKSQDDLLVCYRLRRTPTDTLLDWIRYLRGVTIDVPYKPDLTSPPSRG